MIDLLRAFRSTLRDRAAASDLAGRVAALEQRAVRDRDKWTKQRSAAEARSEALERKLGAAAREVLSKEVVADLLPMRARTLHARRAYARADEFDAMLQSASAPYREALAESEQPRPDLVRASIQGITWWVPVPSSLHGEARDRFVAQQRFPYRTLTLTREFVGGPIQLDIGANIGRMSIPRVLLGDVARVYCAEPDPLNYAALVRNVLSNGLQGLVLPDRAAIGAATGPMRLQHAKYPGGHRLVADGAARGTIQVPCFTLDDWCRRLSIDPQLVNYVKVDAQGWEAQIFRGAADLLSYPHVTWQIEVAPELLEAAGTPPPILYETCAAHFTHFIDLDKEAVGPRVRATRELAESLRYLIGRKKPTDVILFNRDVRRGLCEAGE